MNLLQLNFPYEILLQAPASATNYTKEALFIIAILALASVVGILWKKSESTSTAIIEDLRKERETTSTTILKDLRTERESTKAQILTVLEQLDEKTQSFDRRLLRLEIKAGIDPEKEPNFNPKNEA